MTCPISGGMRRAAREALNNVHQKDQVMGLVIKKHLCSLACLKRSTTDTEKYKCFIIERGVCLNPGGRKYKDFIKKYKDF